MTRRERASWSELAHLQALRLVAVAVTVAMVWVIIQAWQASALLAVLAVFFSPVAILAAVTAIERAFLRW